MNRTAVICRLVRTPVGRIGGALRDIAPADLATVAVTGLLDRLDEVGRDVDDVVLGQCYPNGEAPAIGRVAALNAGLGIDVPGLQLDRRCGSGVQAIGYAAMLIETGNADVVIAGGVESMSQVEFAAQGIRWGTRRASVELVDRLVRSRVTSGGHRYPVAGGMIETAENLRRQYAIPREEQDEFALRSHQRAIAAIDSGRFSTEVIPVPLAGRSVEVDEHPRRDTTLERLAALRPILAGSDPAATVTAGNSSGENDGAAVCLVTSEEYARRKGLEVLAWIRSWAITGVGPEVMGLGPIKATEKALDRAGLKLSQIDLIELNEAFAAQVLAVTREWQFTAGDFDRLNVNGSGISLGHPVGATGARILTTLVHELRRRGGGLGLTTLCIGGGQGITMIIEASS